MHRGLPLMPGKINPPLITAGGAGYRSSWPGWLESRWADADGFMQYLKFVLRRVNGRVGGSNREVYEDAKVEGLAEKHLVLQFA